MGALIFNFVVWQTIYFLNEEVLIKKRLVFFYVSAYILNMYIQFPNETVIF